MDYPTDEIRRRADAALVNFPGSQVHFKWTCGNCGARQVFETPNTIYQSGTCEECGHETKLEKFGFDLIINTGAL